MTTQAAVTAVIPSRDRAWGAATALASALAQRGAQVEAVVVDDGSDPPLDPGSVPGLDDPRVRLIRHDEAHGVSRARNAGVAAARTPWVAFLDDDDLWAPTKTARQLEAAERAGAVLAWATLIVVDESRRAVGRVRAADPATVLDGLVRTNVIGSPSAVLARRDAVLEVGGFDPRLSVLADWDLWLRLAAAGPGAACTEPLVAYTEHPGGMSVAAAERARAELALMAERHPRLGGPELTRWLAATDRRAGLRRRATQEYLRLAISERSPTDLARAAGALLGRQAHDAARRARVAGPEWLLDDGPARP